MLDAVQKLKCLHRWSLKEIIHSREQYVQAAGSSAVIHHRDFTITFTPFKLAVFVLWSSDGSMFICRAYHGLQLCRGDKCPNQQLSRLDLHDLGGKAAAWCNTYIYLLTWWHLYKSRNFGLLLHRSVLLCVSTMLR